MSIGDILVSRKDTIPYIDGSVLDKDAIQFIDGPGSNQNITSSSSMGLSFKAKGAVDPSGVFQETEAGLSVSFNSSNELFLKVLNMRQRSVKNFLDLRDEILSKFASGDIKAKVFVVRGLVLADRYFLQFGSRKEGSVHLNIKTDLADIASNVEADFDLKWSKDVGYTIDAAQGGVLAYRVSSVRLRRHLIPAPVEERLLAGMTEGDAIDTLSTDERMQLLDQQAFEVVDSTFELDDLEHEVEEEAIA